MLMPIHRHQPLSNVKPGRIVEVVDLIGGERSTRRLLEMGLYAGASVEVITGRGWGPVVLRLAGSRLARLVSQKAGNDAVFDIPTHPLDDMLFLAQNHMANRCLE